LIIRFIEAIKRLTSCRQAMVRRQIVRQPRVKWWLKLMMRMSMEEMLVNI